MKKTAAIQLESLLYERFEQTILRGIDLTIDDGDFVILVGPNGSGKSSLIKAINGAITPTAGLVLVDGDNIVGRPIHKIARKVATLTQDVQQSTFSELTVEMNLDLALSRAHPHVTIDKAAYLASFNDTLRFRLPVLAGHLSGGQRQALALAMCFAHTPKVLLLDEHTSALDPKAAEALMALTNEHIAQKKLTTIMITHSLDHALQYGNRLIVMKDGCVAATLNAAQKHALSKQDLIYLAY